MADDLVLLRQICQQLLSSVRDNKPSGDRSALTQKALVVIVRLKGAIRDTVWKIDELKKQTTDTRSRLDQTNLQLQNLLYERDYFRGEVRENQNFR